MRFAPQRRWEINLDRAMVLDVEPENRKRTRVKIMRECFREEVRNMSQALLEIWLRQHHRLAQRRPLNWWRYKALKQEHEAREREAPLRRVG